MNPGTAPARWSQPRRWHAVLRARGAALPRETRDTLFLLAVLAWTILPHAGHVPLWCALMAGAVLVARALLALRSAPLPSRWTVLAVLALAAVLTWTTNRTLLGKEAGITMLVVLAALKTLELRARRDTFVVFFLGFFLVLTHFLYSQSLLTALLMLVAVWGLLTALVLAHMPVGQPALAAAAMLSMRTALLGLPLMALLFILFPRIAPLWGLPPDAMARTGLSGTMSLGTVAELAQDPTIALRVNFQGAERPQALYFRGPVLTRFNGRIWSAAEMGLPLGVQVRAQGEPLRYTVTVEPLRVSALPLLEMTPQPPQFDSVPEGFTLTRRADLQWVASAPLTDRVRLQGQAWLDLRYGVNESARVLAEARELPAGFNPRMRAWADEFRAAQGAGRTVADLSAALLQHIRTGGYIYTLAPGEYGAHVVDEFWLDRKEGFCEHFAASFVVVMRLWGVPARVVTGYLGGEYNNFDNNLEVRNSDAHAWAEYWDPARGWTRVDPTAAVAPDRVLRGQRLQPAPGFVAGAIGSVNPHLLRQLREVWNALENRWNQSVLNYSRGRQLDLLRWLGVSTPRWEQLAYLLIAVISALSTAGALWAWWDRHRMDPWLRAYRRAGDLLRRRGVDVPAHLPPRMLAQRVHEHFGPAGAAVCAALLGFEAARYATGAPGDARRAGALARLHAGRLAQALRLVPMPPPRDTATTPAETPAANRPQHA